MLGGNCLCLSSQALFSIQLHNKQDTYHLPKHTCHLLPATHSSSLTSPAMPALPLSLGVLVPDYCSSDFPEAEGLPAALGRQEGS